MASVPSQMGPSNGKSNGKSSNGKHIERHPVSATNRQSRQGVSSENEQLATLHRLAEVRCQQGVSVRCAARQLGKDVATVREQEQETSDLLLSELYAWQGILDVPVSELLMDQETPLSRPVMERARLVRLMKTAAAILEDSKSTSVRLLAERMIVQLVEIMPELKDVGAWHTVGQRRSLDEFGRTFENRISEDMPFHYQDGDQE